MRRSLGTTLVLAGAVSLFFFAVRGTLDARGADLPTWKLPFTSLGRDYPSDGGLLIAGIWGIGLGVGILGMAGSRPGGTVARIFLANALLILTMLGLGAIGARAVTGDTRQEFVPLIGVFFGTALLEIGAGLILFILALFERPRGTVSLMVGSAVYASAATLGVLAFLWGTQ